VTTEKPEWESTKDENWLAWVNEQLDELDEQEVLVDDPLEASVRLLASMSPEGRREAIRKMMVSHAKDSWRYGDVAPLCKRFPELAETFVPPPRWKEQLRQRDRTIKRQLMKLAVRDVHRIQKLWRDHYDGRWKRRRGHGPTAAQLAARRHGVSPEDLLEAMKRAKRVLRSAT
jgi:hypothetical protein